MDDKSHLELHEETVMFMFANTRVYLSKAYNLNSKVHTFSQQ